MTKNSSKNESLTGLMAAEVNPGPSIIYNSYEFAKLNCNFGLHETTKILLANSDLDIAFDNKNKFSGVIFKMRAEVSVEKRDGTKTEKIDSMVVKYNVDK